MLTTAQIHQLVSVLSIHAVRKMVTKGYTTKAQMLSFSPTESARKGGKASAKQARSRGWVFSL